MSSPVSVAEGRVRRTQQLYSSAVAAYLGARTDPERSLLGKAMYFAQLATIEARHNPDGCAEFLSRSEALILEHNREMLRRDCSREAA